MPPDPIFVEVTRTHDRVSLSWRRPGRLVYTIALVAWLGLLTWHTLFWAAIASLPGELNLATTIPLFGTITLISLVLIYGCLAGLVNRRSLTFKGDRATLTTRPLRWGRDRHFVLSASSIVEDDGDGTLLLRDGAAPPAILERWRAPESARQVAAEIAKARPAQRSEA